MKILTRILIPVAFCGLLLSSCGSQGYRIQSAESQASLANQIDVQVSDYHAASLKQLEAKEDRTYTAHETGLLMLLDYTEKGTPLPELPSPWDGLPATYDSYITVLIANLKTSVDDLQSDYKNEQARYDLLRRITNAIRKIAARDVTIATRETNDIEQLRQLAEEHILDRYRSKEVPKAPKEEQPNE